jgi:hypothetical protein
MQRQCHYVQDVKTKNLRNTLIMHNPFLPRNKGVSMEERVNYASILYYRILLSKSSIPCPIAPLPQQTKYFDNNIIKPSLAASNQCYAEVLFDFQASCIST